MKDECNLERGEKGRKIEEETNFSLFEKMRTCLEVILVLVLLLLPSAFTFARRTQKQLSQKVGITTLLSALRGLYVALSLSLSRFDLVHATSKVK